MTSTAHKPAAFSEVLKRFTFCKITARVHERLPRYNVASFLFHILPLIKRMRHSTHSKRMTHFYFLHLAHHQHWISFFLHYFGYCNNFYKRPLKTEASNRNISRHPDETIKCTDAISSSFPRLWLIVSASTAISGKLTSPEQPAVF